MARPRVLPTLGREEAMAVADRIVVMNHGRIEQEGSPHDVYEHPGNAFVMSFVGPVTSLGGALVRPHDVELATERDGDDALEARVVQVTRLGFEIRLALELPDGTPLSAQLTRDQAADLELAIGTTIWARPTRLRTFDAAVG